MRSALLFAFSATLALCGSVQSIRLVPDGAKANAVQVDSAGNLYLAGSLLPADPKSSNDNEDAFVAKLSPDGSQVIYFLVLSGSSFDRALALALGSDGSAYVTGSTSSNDFPVTPGAFQTSFQTGQLGFVTKLDPSGKIAYSTYLSGIYPAAIAVNAAGEVFITGSASTGFPTTPGAVSAGTSGFIAKLDATGGNLLVGITGFGGRVIAFDSQGNIYAAGDAALPAYQTTLGALQSTHPQNTCGGTFNMLFRGSPCSYQHVEKLNPFGTTVLYATFLAGAMGASPAALAVDSRGNAILAGTTYSTDYPTTQGALETAYSHTSFVPGPTVIEGKSITEPPPPSTGYITKVNQDGSGLIWSTYFGGSNQERITGMSLDASGAIYVSGEADSPDLPGLGGTPDPCKPSATQGLGFVAQIAADGATAGPAQLIYGATYCFYCFVRQLAGIPASSINLAVAAQRDGKAVVVGTPGVAVRVDLFGQDRLACLTDSADNVQLTKVTPGQLLTLYGTALGPAAPAQPPGGPAPSFNGVTVTFGGIQAPILYTSDNQVNLQVPFGIAGQNLIEMAVTSTLVSPPINLARTLAVGSEPPSVFLSVAAFSSLIEGYAVCGKVTVAGVPVLALNDDGTLNSCMNPARAGSTVTAFLNGAGNASGVTTMHFQIPTGASVSYSLPVAARDTAMVWTTLGN